MIQDIMRFVAEMLDQGQKVALVTLIKKDGSAPGAEGQMMAVLADGSSQGTIGGGTSEHKVIKRCTEAINNQERTFSFSYDLAENGLLCGGSIEGFCNILGLGERLVLFGAGHVSQAIAPLAQSIGFQVFVCDDRADLCNYFSKDTQYLACSEESWADLLPLHPEDYVVICTRGHEHDLSALRYCIDKKLHYLGMIGSKRKVTSIYQALIHEGVSKENLSHVYAPIGINIADGRPSEIAISILAEILAVKNSGQLAHMKLDLSTLS